MWKGEKYRGDLKKKKEEVRKKWKGEGEIFRKSKRTMRSPMKQVKREEKEM